ncbi:TonB-dependent receptor [Alteromonas halophila]|nr:TonB-dependent receptor [Alteromonas halophila]
MLPFTSALADDPITDIERIRISGNNNFNDGAFVSSSQGWVSGDTLVERPMLRTGEMLEFIPGMMVTQHSGSGKANQYFLRGFNLDHGTDFAVSVDGMPVNMRSHGHGQGYSDLNYVIPEAVESLSYFKGTYYASIGDFSGAGGARFALKNSLNGNAVHLTLGENNYRRGVLLNQVAIGEGRALSAIEYQSYDGPWTDVSEDIDKKNAMLRYVTPLLDGELSITGMAYDNSWNGADQIPARAVQSGRIDRLGSIDPLAGGETSRYSLSANYRSSQVTASVYAIDSDLTLYSNFTYFLDNPDRGDQFEQADDRQIFGGDIATTRTLPDMQDTQLTVGVQWRYDDIDNVGLYNTVARERVSTRRQDSIESLSYALYGQTHTHLTDALSLTLGARVDTLDVDVSSLLPDNSGSQNDTLLSLKTSLKYAVTEQATAFVNWGQGFHSNDARGAVISVDPVSGEPAQPAPLLVRSNGYETGITVTDERNYNLSASLWLLELDSELVYVGDAGFTEPSRPSRRYGVEVSAYYWLSQHINADIEAAWTRARFSDEVAGEGDHIPGTVPGVVSAGLSWYASSNRQGLSATLRGRYLSSRTVTGDDSVSPPSTFIVNGQLAYDWESWTVTLEVLNMLDSDDHDIDYYYASRLPGEPDEGIEDLHYHPVEPRTARLTVSLRY